MRKMMLAAVMTVAMVGSAVAAMPRLAVMNLENKSGFRGYEKDLGQGMADMLVTQFVNTKRVKVIERAELEKVLTEQKLGLSGAITAQTAAQVGKLLGVEYMVIGSVNEFGTNKSVIGGFGVGMVNHSANVGLDIRLIDTTSAEVVAAATGEAKKTTRGVGISNSAIFPTSVALGSSGFNSSLIGKATRSAVEDAVAKVMKNLGGNWSGVILKISEDGVVTINGGENVGEQANELYKVIRKGEELIDPETGESLGSEEKVMGEIKITEVKPKFANAKIVNGKDILKDDRVEKK